MVKKQGKALGKHVLSLYLTQISQVVKIRDVQKLQQNNENYPVIRDQMAYLAIFQCVLLLF